MYAGTLLVELRFWFKGRLKCYLSYTHHEKIALLE